MPTLLRLAAIRPETWVPWPLPSATEVLGVATVKLRPVTIRPARSGLAAFTPVSSTAIFTPSP
jgi:hypothetical protein